jgi:hypothetical protein
MTRNYVCFCRLTLVLTYIFLGPPGRDHHEPPYRYIADWAFVLEETGHDGTSYVHRELNPLVAQNSRRRNGYIVGRMLPKPPPPPRPNDDYDDDTGTTTAGSVAVPALFVRFPAPAIQITMDRDPEHGQYRGYWFHGSDQCDA